MLIHSVYFWLDKDLTGEQRAAFREGIGELLKIDLIGKGFTGTPAGTEPRPVIDNSWDHSLVLHFADQAAHDAYQAHPDHDVFVASFKDLWAKVLVLDTEVS